MGAFFPSFKNNSLILTAASSDMVDKLERNVYVFRFSKFLSTQAKIKSVKVWCDHSAENKFADIWFE